MIFHNGWEECVEVCVGYGVVSRIVPGPECGIGIDAVRGADCDDCLVFPILRQSDIQCAIGGAGEGHFEAVHDIRPGDLLYIGRQHEFAACLVGCTQSNS